MPGIFHQPVGRRGFLRVSALGAAAMVTSCRSPAPRSGRPAEAAEFRVALFSDTHVPADAADAYRGFRPVDNLRAIVPQMIEARPEAAILCGDAARLEGKPEDYEALKGLLAPLAARAPISIALGNHDDRANFRKAFAPPSGPGGKELDRHVLVVEHAAVRLVVLDSLLFPNKTPGLLGQAQRAWLGGYLAETTDRPVVVFVHHTLEDRDGDLLDADRLFAILEPRRHVKAVFYGHSHVWEVRRRERLQLVNLPAVGYNFNDKDPVGWVDARFRRDGMDLTLRALAGNRAEDGLVRSFRWT
jgi:Icc protein